MESFSNERRVQQGEDFNIDILLSQDQTEYIPFIVSSERLNPFLVCTVASTKFEKNERYVMSMWNEPTMLDGDLNEIELPRFIQTVPYPLGEMAIGVLPGLPVGHDPFEALYQYTMEEDEIDPETNHKPYHYIYWDDMLVPHYDYEFRVRFNFTGDITQHWGSQNYMYQITLVDGELMNDFMLAGHDTNPELDWQSLGYPLEVPEDHPDFGTITLEEFQRQWILDHQRKMFDFIKRRVPNYFQPDVEWDSPLGTISTPQAIMTPTKLQVDNNLRNII